MIERVRRPKEHEALIYELGKKDGGMGTLKAVLTLSAALAYKMGLDRKPFSDSGEKIPLVYFSAEYERTFISSLALYNARDVSIIHPKKIDEQILIFEEYANAGLSYIQEHLSDLSSFPEFVLEIATRSEDRGELLDEIFNNPFKS